MLEFQTLKGSRKEGKFTKGFDQKIDAKFEEIQKVVDEMGSQLKKKLTSAVTFQDLIDCLIQNQTDVKKQSEVLKIDLANCVQNVKQLFDYVMKLKSIFTKSKIIG